jgi:protein-tyrosine phosphatase
MSQPSFVSRPGWVNVRDLGGLVGAAPRRLRRRRLWRADFPGVLGEPDFTPLAGRGVRTVVDLRDLDEAAAAPPRFEAAGFTVVHVPILEGDNEAFLGRAATIEAGYAHMAATKGTQFARAITAIAEAEPGGVLVHCTAGKDRTGITIALVLTLLGVGRRAIVADYSRTEARLAGAWMDRISARLKREFGLTDDTIAARYEILAGSPPKAITAALDTMADGWGSVPDYLAAHGLADGVAAALRQRCFG